MHATAEITPQSASAAQGAVISSPPCSDRVATYAAQLDARLAACPDDKARAALLSRQMVYWTRAYNEFATAVDMGDLDPPPDGPDVWDYQLTLCEISTRRERLKVRSAP